MITYGHAANDRESLGDFAGIKLIGALAGRAAEAADREIVGVEPKGRVL
jgi:hypothetical protein